VAWFIGQSAVMIVLAFLLGLLVGWLVWARRWRGEASSSAASAGTATATRADAAVSEKAAGPAEPVTAGTTTDSDTGDDIGLIDNPAPTVPVQAGPPAETVPGSTTPHIPAPRSETTMVPAVPATDEAGPSDAAVAGVASMDQPDGPATEDSELAANGAAHAADTPIDTSEIVSAQDAGADHDDEPAGADLDDEPAVADLDVEALAAAESATVVPLHTVDDELAAVEATAARPSIDNLERVEGIGPKFAAALVAAGIRTYDQLADASEDQLRKAIKDAGYAFAPSIRTWARQARFLSDGDEEAFESLVARLTAGRDVSVPAQAAPLPAPPTPPDDLARIEGIGPRFAGALIAAGIRTFGQLADADEATLRKALTDAGLRFAPSLPTWPAQARLLADGDEDGFAELTARLIAGRATTDDLERIEGIGPKFAAALRAAGIRTYRSLANSDNAKLRKAVTAGGLDFAPSLTTWSRQARLLADGDEEGFADLTRRLIAGRDEERA
jgi:predicted flap endonuclease-1-like 5' DNA nuclease